MTFKRLSVLIAVGAALISPPAVEQLAAQSEGGSVGLELRGGHIFQEDNARGTTFAGDLIFGSRVVRPFIGANYWHTKRLGELQAPGGRLGVRFEMPPGGRLAPFFQASVHGHNVDADVPGNAAREDELDGFDFGGGVGAGLGLRLDNSGLARLVVEGQRVFMKDVSDLSHWGVTAGLRITFGGERAIKSKLLAERAEQERLEAERRAAEERRRQEAERLAAERERQAAEQRAAERERQAAEEERRAAERAAQINRALDAVSSVRETDRGLTLTVGQGLFAVDEYVLSREAQAEVSRIATVLELIEASRIAVEGHADSTGTDATNQPLSENRAKSVRDALIGAGVPGSQIETAGFSSDRPIADNATVEGRAENRRVEVILIGTSRPAAPVTDN